MLDSAACKGGVPSGPQLSHAPGRNYLRALLARWPFPISLVPHVPASCLAAAVCRVLPAAAWRAQVEMRQTGKAQHVQAWRGQGSVSETQSI